MSKKTIHPEEIRGAVRQRYGQIARDFDGAAASCCGPSDCCGDSGANVAMVEALYETADVAELPFDVTGMSLGCGDPVTLATLGPGQTVLDLGSGGGIDCFLAAKKVGLEGKVIGVDMTPEMIARARESAADRPNVEFRLGELAHLPVADGTVDVILSNCVVNLVPDKAQVFREAWRVLRSGGRLAISDVLRVADFPPEILARPGSLSACISGAATEAEITGHLRTAGFTEVRIVVNDRSGEFIKDWDPGSGAEQFVRAALIEARKT